MSLLTSLARAYDRLPNAPAYGFSTEKIGLAISLGEDGSATVIDLRGDEKKRPARMMMVPQPPKKAVNIAPSFLWGNTGYVLGIMAEVSKAERVQRTHRAFVEFHVRLLEGTGDAGLRAFLGFLRREDQVFALANGLPSDLVGLNLAFVYEPDRLTNMWLHDRPAAKEIWRKGSDPAIAAGQVCLVYGDVRPVARLHPRIKGIRNESGKDADSLVSFNLDAFTSYGHKQGDNAPVSEAAAFAYTTALNHFLTKDSGHRIQIGDASTVFWADGSGQEAEAEGLFFAMFGGGDNQDADDKDATKKIRIQLERIQRLEPLAQIAPQLKKGVRFHVLGLAPNAARLSVRLYWEDDFGTLVEHYAAYVQDVAIEPAPARPVFSIRAAVLRTAPAKIEANGKTAFDKDHISPLLSGELLRAVLTGGRFPRALLGLLVMRVRSDHVLDRIRISLIKGLIVRDMRLEDRLPKRPDGSTMKDYLMRSDPDDPNIARRLGRLFALIERAQQATLGDRINATVKDKFLGSAAATPARVFPMLLKNSELHHLKRLRNGHSDADWIKDADHARRVAAYIGRDIGLLWGNLGEPVPIQQSSEEQGMFLVGYYQERYAKRAVDEPADESDTTENDSEE